MSRRHLLILLSLTSLISGAMAACVTAQVKPAESVATLLLRDEIQNAEAILQKSPRTAETVAFQGEIEFRKGNFDRARTLYQSSIQMNERTARAHFGLGKLALAKVKTKEAVQSFKRAIELDPKEPLYHFFASEAADLDKNPAESRKQLEEYVRLKPHDDEDRLTEAKAGLALLDSFGGKEYGIVEGPNEPAAVPFRKELNLIFTDVM
ncbi:MAG TPA: tetratricopeptide repeat protein, partial [Terriglobia bacterium]|nr:tetratricopeptide repeat protein [Terriglobia bacterium]